MSDSEYQSTDVLYITVYDITEYIEESKAFNGLYHESYKHCML